ncbi:MAG: hypothetical protein J0I84_09125 [Terrimonas sp.]|nr:hypothetical protein [Terrimonas sp.]OJY94835.1 MAG: hypothetical protein BGP13_14295 [Sphingobacteriales bacterium 40-81]
MENVSILTDFPKSEPQQYYKKIAENVSEEYTIYTGGNFIYISNTKNRTVRFTPANFKSVEISTDQISLWLERIQQKYPQF